MRLQARLLDVYRTELYSWFMGVQQKGAEEARSQLPELLTAAENGQVTIITRHGRAVAALMPIEQFRRASQQQRPITPLEGTGRGLWGRNSTRTIAKLRDEWDR